MSDVWLAVNSRLNRRSGPVLERVGEVSAAQADEVVLKAIAPYRNKYTHSAVQKVFEYLSSRVGIGTSSSDVALLAAQNMAALSPAVQKKTMRALGSSLDSAARLLLDSANVSDREAAAVTLCLRRSPMGAKELARLAGDDSSSVRDRAVESLLTLGRSTPVRSSLWDAMDRALAQLADRVMDLPDRAVLRAALPLLANPGAHLSRILNDGEHPANFVFRSLVRRGGAEMGAGELIRLLRMDAVAPAALDALQSAAVTTDDWAGALSATHLLLAPGRGTRIRRLPERDKQLPTGAIIGELPHSALRSLPRWINANNWQGKGLTQVIDRLVGCEDPTARASLLVQFRQTKRPDKMIHDALQDLSLDRCPSVSRSALLSILDEDSKKLRTLVRRQLRSPSQANRICAAQTLRRRDPFAQLDRDDPLADATALRRALKRDRAATLDALRVAIGGGAATRRIRAISLAIRVEAAPDCELELLSTAASRDPKLAASAVVALGRLTSQAAVQAVRACLQHDDDRVRANAVEAASKHDSLIEPMCRSLDSSVAREKCNAVHVLLSRVEPKLQSQGRARLNEMLTDKRADHRRSALWLVERLGCTEVAGQVASLVSNESNNDVRNRAQRTARRLLAEMRAGSALCLTDEAATNSPALQG